MHIRIFFLMKNYFKTNIYIFTTLRVFIICYHFKMEQYIPYLLVCDLFSKNVGTYLHIRIPYLPKKNHDSNFGSASVSEAFEIDFRFLFYFFKVVFVSFRAGVLPELRRASADDDGGRLLPRPGHGGG